ncbi:hypothetical protein XENOCAPTIV_029755, partial [Xenoophorus captivus]
SNSHSPSPPSSFNAFSLVSSEQDNPSTSGCRLVPDSISAQHELSVYVFPVAPKKRSKGKSNTVNTLKYALR